ncbi:hypothetical protein AYI70_g3894 [Smittium culicis]|uniref:Uncharacterized protein n=1 Tax=Smittium culicis TaxID=133412 RepID=A0A1R1Y1E5_9FUNG|nr:hypothetical protein AYI70_g3894 [Smittium culicis]
MYEQGQSEINPYDKFEESLKTTIDYSLKNLNIYKVSEESAKLYESYSNQVYEWPKYYDKSSKNLTNIEVMNEAINPVNSMENGFDPEILSIPTVGTSDENFYKSYTNLDLLENAWKNIK